MTGQTPPIPQRPDGFTGGDVLLAGDQLIDPATTLATVHRLLTEPDNSDRLLPEIKLRTTASAGTLGDVYYFTNTDGTDVAQATLITDPEQASERLWNPTVAEGLSDRGFGTAMYLYFIDQALTAGYDLRTDLSGQTEDAVKMWRRLHRLGIAQVAQEFSLPEGKTHYRGYYVVNGNNRPKLTLEEGA